MRSTYCTLAPAHARSFGLRGSSQEAPGLPKTRSGKIMRRILRKVASHEFDGLGDISTLADPMVVAELIAAVAVK